MKKQTILLLSLISLCLAMTAFADEPLFKVDTSVEKLPPEFYDLDDSLYQLEKDPKRPYEVVVVLANDIGTGDDYGHTHEFKIIGVTKLDNGIRLRVSYSTDLYTQKIGEANEDGLTPQHFMDENIGKFMADNIESGKLFYWKGEVGWHQLSDVSSNNLFRASAQQILFHKLIEPFKPQKQPLNISEGYGSQNGVIAGGSLGIQKNYKYGKIHLHPQAEIGISESTLKGADYKYASVSLESTYVIKPEYRANLVLESQAKRHSTGTQVTHSVNANIETRKWVAGAGVYLNQGTLDNHTRYNRPNINGKIDPIYMIYGSYQWGGNKSSSDTNFLKPKEIITR